MRTAMDEIERDQWGRPILPDPETGVEKAWTRPTTMAKTLSDQGGLWRWKLRTLYGLLSPSDDPPAVVDQKVHETLETASEAAQTGTELHRLCEQVDLGELKPDQCGDHADDVTAYLAVLNHHLIDVKPYWVERMVVCPKFGVAGTPDRLVRIEGKRHLVVLDIKTGNGALTYGALDTTMQLAAYAHSTHSWRGEWVPNPEIDQTLGLVLHLPPFTGRANLYKVDLHMGHRALQLAQYVRDMRKALPALEIWDE